jgi:hypothetical protein
MRVSAAAFTAFVLLAAGCSRDVTPAGAYRAFARAVAERDADRAFGLLSKDTQAWLDARAAGVARLAPGVVPASGRQLMLGDAALGPGPRLQVVVLRESRDVAVLEVSDGGARREVEMVREGSWRVRIPPPAARPR